MQKRPLPFPLLAAMYFFLGCNIGKLTEPEQPRALVASTILKTESPLLVNGQDAVSIKRVDGRGPMLFEHKWVLEPGRHEVEIEATLKRPLPGDRAELTKVLRVLEVELRAGEEYTVRIRAEGDEVYLWIDGGQPPEVIGGDAPPTFETR